ncbi:unnamed protein product [Anisakis simplex]|uniref:EB domain-containing protein n=1 Tax=Anisakis simplex TaxID=6269 RepID=A0A0M3JT40_ANISI|nr:unnamed protein product [Anisakis simplex]
MANLKSSILLAALIADIAVASYVRAINQSKHQPFTIRSRRQACNCISTPDGEFQCECSNPILGDSQLQQTELQKQLQLLEGLSEKCNCLPSIITNFIQTDPDAPTYTCQCYQQPQPPVITSGGVAIETIPSPTTSPTIIIEPSVVPSELPTIIIEPASVSPPELPVITVEPSVVSPEPSVEVLVPVLPPQPPVIPVEQVISPSYVPLGNQCPCVLIQVSPMSAPQQNCDCLSQYSASNINPIPFMSSTIPTPILPSTTITPYITGDLQQIDQGQPEMLPCSYYFMETCVCPPNYVQCAPDTCCIEALVNFRQFRSSTMVTL